MKKNLGNADRAVRLLLGGAFLFFSGTAAGAWTTFLLILGAVFVVTGVLGCCPLYSLFGFSTCPAREVKKA